jgi:Plant transposon protein
LASKYLKITRIILNYLKITQIILNFLKMFLIVNNYLIFQTRFSMCVVDHSRRILHVTRGFYGATNDMTITKYDQFLGAVRSRTLYENVTYDVIDANGVTVQVTGVYFICDGGYMKDSFLTDPYAFRSSRSVIYWSEWLESLRKDVECLSGILKSRWRILRNPVTFHKLEDIENIMYCCCILHNLVISADGIDTAWEDDVAWDTLHPDADLDGDDIVGPPAALDYRNESKCSRPTSISRMQ